MVRKLKRKDNVMLNLGRRHSPLTRAPADILAGLAPSLVEDLAQFVGSTDDDLLVSFQLMPYGDRATLAAYGIIELETAESGRRRVVRVHPAATELVNVAAESLVDSAGEQMVSVAGRARVGRLVSAAVPLVAVVGENNPAGVQVPGRIVEIGPDRVTVEVGIQAGAGEPVEEIQIAPDGDLGDEGALVILKYDSPGDTLAHPQAVARKSLVDA